MAAALWALGSALCGGCIFVGAAGNSLTVAAVASSPKLRTPIGYLVLSLAVDNLICSVLVVPLNMSLFVNEGKWRFGRGVCVAQKILGFGSTATASILIFFIAVNRYVKICRAPDYYAKIFTNRIICTMIFIAWIYPHAFFTLFSLGYGAELKFSTEKEECVLLFTTAYPWLVLMGTYLIMLTGLVFSYGKIYSVVTRSRQNIRSSQYAAPETDAMSMALLKMLIATTVSYIVCVLVPLVAGLIGDMADDTYVETPAELFFVHVPTAIEVVLNPIIYGILNEEYRRAFWRILIPKSCLPRPGVGGPDPSSIIVNYET